MRLTTTQNAHLTIVNDATYDATRVGATQIKDRTKENRILLNLKRLLNGLSGNLARVVPDAHANLNGRRINLFNVHLALLGNSLPLNLRVRLITSRQGRGIK